MAIQQRFESIIQSGSGDVYRLKLYDLDHDSSTVVQNASWGWLISDGVQTIETLYDSCAIRWDGQTDKVHQAIIGSVFEVSFLANDDKAYGILTAMKYATEFKLGIVVERWDYTAEAYEVYWRGVALPEAIRVDYSDMPMVINITFTDGLSTLRDVTYVDTDYTIYEGFETARSQIGKCLRHLPHLELWGDQDDFFFEACDIFHDNQATYNASNEITAIDSVLDNVGCRQEIWYETRKYQPPFHREQVVRQNGMTAYEVIEHWMVSMGLRLCHTGGVFVATSPFLKTSSRADRLYKSDKRTLVDTTYDDSAPTADSSNTQLLADAIDLTADSVLQGSSMSFLHPVRGIYYTHLQGGSSRLFPVVPWVAVEGDFPQTDIAANLLGQIYDVSENYNVSFPLSNDTATVPTDRDLRIVGRFQHWFRIGDLPSNKQNAARGMQFEVKMKVKVGQYYLKQTVGLAPSSDFSNDQSFGDIIHGITQTTSWRPLIITSDVEWTTTSTDRFSFPAFLVPTDRNVPAPDPLQYDDGNGNITEYPCGFGTRRHPNHPQKMKYDNASRDLWMAAYELVLDSVLPSLPTTTTEEEGIDISVEVIGYYNDGTTTTVQEELYPTNPFHPDGARIIGFNMYIGDGTDEDNAFYYAEGSTQNGTEMVLGGETMVASRVVEDYGEMGAIVATGSDGYSHEWYSENGFVYGEGKRNLEVLADEHVRQRVKTRDTFNLQYLARTAEQPWFGPHQRYKWTHEGIAHYLIPFNVTHQLTENVLTVEGYEGQRDTGDITEHNDSNKKDVGTNVVGEGGGISGTSPIYTPRASFGTSNPGITSADQTKLDNITVTQAVDLDTIETDVSDNSTNITAITNVLKTAFDGDGAGVYSDSSKNTGSSHISLTSTTAKVQAGGGNTSLDLNESSPGQMTLAVQVGSSGNETSATAIDIQGTTGSQLPNITISGNLSGVDLNDLDDVTTTGVTSGQVLAWNGTNFAPADQSGGGASDTDEIELKMFFLQA